MILFFRFKNNELMNYKKGEVEETEKLCKVTEADGRKGSSEARELSVTVAVYNLFLCYPLP